MKEMTKGEREELKRLARERARVAKADAAARSADLKAMFEQQIITEYDYDRDEVWQAAVEEAKKAVEEAQAIVAKRCEELGIPAVFAPRITASWQGGGQFQMKQEQIDLRRAAYKRIEALERTARHEIDRKALEIQTQLVSAGLTSERAIEFLGAMPSAEELMPAVTLTDLDSPGRRSLGPGDGDWF